MAGRGSLGALAFGSTSAGLTSCTQTEATQNDTAQSTAKRKVLMKVGCQHGGTGKSNLEYLARHGVFHMDGGSPKFIEGVGWDLEDSIAKQEKQTGTKSE